MKSTKESLPHSFIPKIIPNLSLRDERGDGLAFIKGNPYIHRFEDEYGLAAIVEQLGHTPKDCVILRRANGEIIDPDTYLDRHSGPLPRVRDLRRLEAALTRTTGMSLHALYRRYQDQQSSKAPERQRIDTNTVIRRKKHPQTPDSHL